MNDHGWLRRVLLLVAAIVAGCLLGWLVATASDYYTLQDDPARMVRP